LDRHAGNSTLRKVGVTCTTCDVEESFYSSISVKRFRLEHIGHEVIESELAPAAAPNGLQDADDSGKVRLLKVMVELVTLPSYSAPVFTITGVKDDLKSAFVHVVPPSQRDQVKETLEKGKYLDSGPGDTVYFWEPKSISFSEDADLALSFGHPSSVGSNAAEPKPAANEAVQMDAGSMGEESVLALDELAPQEGPVLLVSTDRTASDSLPALEQASVKPSRKPTEAPTPEQPESDEAATMRSQPEVEDDNNLLVSRSWYIEAGPKYLGEAIRVSRLLRPFSGAVEPAYTIGVLVDDILSVETANGEIGGEMTKQIEDAGYKLSRVSVARGRPVAWFKRKDPSGRDALEP
jgi:hypothetical protein